MRSPREESGFTLPEMLIVLTITTIIMGGLATIFGLGLNTAKTSSSTLASQAGVVVALDRLDYEARCASSATLVSGGAGVTLSIPSYCTHTTQSPVTWCVNNGSLVRYTNSLTCTGTGGQTLTTNVTSATPFSCVSALNTYAAVKVVLTVNTGTTAATASSGTDTITLENAALTTSTSTGCS
jgi:prepilin-type N-terminal cleavage/methylation domain-containing protein